MKAYQLISLLDQTDEQERQLLLLAIADSLEEEGYSSLASPWRTISRMGWWPNKDKALTASHYWTGGKKGPFRIPTSIHFIVPASLMTAMWKLPQERYRFFVVATTYIDFPSVPLACAALAHAIHKLDHPDDPPDEEVARLFTCTDAQIAATG